MSMEVFVSPIVSVYQVLALAIGLTAVTFIAAVLWLDYRLREAPLPPLPRKRRAASST